MDLLTQLQTFVAAEAQKIVASMFPKMSAADQTDVDAILPHVESMLMRDLGAKILAKIGTSVPTVLPEINVILAALGVAPVVAAAAK